MYTIYIQNSYKMDTDNCMQNVSHVLTHFDPSVVHVLRRLTIAHNSNLKLADQAPGGKYQINGLKIH